MGRASRWARNILQPLPPNPSGILPSHDLSSDGTAAGDPIPIPLPGVGGRKRGKYACCCSASMKFSQNGNRTTAIAMTIRKNTLALKPLNSPIIQILPAIPTPTKAGVLAFRLCSGVSASQFCNEKTSDAL